MSKPGFLSEPRRGDLGRERKDPYPPVPQLRSWLYAQMRASIFIETSLGRQASGRGLSEVSETAAVVSNSCGPTSPSLPSTSSSGQDQQQRLSLTLNLGCVSLQDCEKQGCFSNMTTVLPSSRLVGGDAGPFLGQVTIPRLDSGPNTSEMVRPRHNSGSSKYRTAR